MTRRPARIPAAHVREWLYAAEAGDLTALKRILAANPRMVDAQGTGPYWVGNFRALHYAVSRGHLAVVRWLIAQGASVAPVAGDADWAPIHFAVVPPRRGLVRLLVRHGAAIDIFVAAASGDVRRVTKLIRENPAAVTSRGPDGATPLHFSGSVAVAKALLAAGADPQARDRFHDSTPVEWAVDRARVAALIASAAGDMDIHVASAIGNLPQVRALVRKNPDAVHARIEGADKTIGAKGETPLGVAARHGRRTVVVFLLRNGARAGVAPSPLTGAVHRRDRVIVKRLLDAGADPNAFGPRGHAALHAACVYGDLPMIRLLLSKGAALDLKDRVHHGTPLDWAEYHDHKRAAALLKSRRT